MSLSSCGIQKRLPRALVYGTLQSWGLGIRDPFWSQLIQHLQVILWQSHQQTPTQMLLEENMELVQMYVGSEINFWELPFKAYGCLPPPSYVHTWDSILSTLFTLKGLSLAVPRQRQHDV